MVDWTERSRTTGPGTLPDHPDTDRSDASDPRRNEDPAAETPFRAVKESDRIFVAPPGKRLSLWQQIVLMNVVLGMMAMVVLFGGPPLAVAIGSVAAGAALLLPIELSQRRRR